MSLLEVSGLTRRYGEATVLPALSLSLAAGRAIALVGPNGSGKSTALRCVVGADEATAGKVLLDGAPLDERSPAVRRAMATVLDDLDFFPDLSVVEHLDLIARAHRVEDAEALVDAVLDEVALLDHSGQLPGSLSSGQRQRLALATVLVRPRRLLVLDEPEQRLDVAGVEWLRDRLLAEKSAGAGILFASHDEGLVAAVADEVVTLGGAR